MVHQTSQTLSISFIETNKKSFQVKTKGKRKKLREELYFTEKEEGGETSNYRNGIVIN